MPQDFAKQHQAKQQKGPNRQEAAPRRPVWVWFASGFISGGFVTMLAALWFFVPSGDGQHQEKPTPEPQAQTQTRNKSDEMQWDFYEIFPRSVVPVVEEYAETGEKVNVDQFSWILQAGSFQDPDDADELRASLLLMGLDAKTTPVEVSGKDWFRVVVGPFDSELERNRAQDTLAQAEIRAIPIRIPK